MKSSAKINDNLNDGTFSINGTPRESFVAIEFDGTEAIGDRILVKSLTSTSRVLVEECEIVTVTAGFVGTVSILDDGGAEGNVITLSGAVAPDTTVGNKEAFTGWDAGFDTYSTISQIRKANGESGTNFPCEVSLEITALTSVAAGSKLLIRLPAVTL